MKRITNISIEELEREQWTSLETVPKSGEMVNIYGGLHEGRLKIVKREHNQQIVSKYIIQKRFKEDLGNMTNMIILLKIGITFKEYLQCHQLATAFDFSSLLELELTHLDIGRTPLACKYCVYLGFSWIERNDVLGMHEYLLYIEKRRQDKDHWMRHCAWFALMELRVFIKSMNEENETTKHYSFLHNASSYSSFTKFIVGFDLQEFSSGMVKLKNGFNPKIRFGLRSITANIKPKYKLKPTCIAHQNKWNAVLIEWDTCCFLVILFSYVA